MEFKELVQKRRSIRRYMLGKEPDWRKIIRAIDTARFIPSAGNQFNLRYILVSNKEIISQIAEACQQHFVASANYIVVCTSEEAVLERLYGERGKRYTAQQAGASMENFILALTEEGLATTWVGHFYDEMIKRLLNIPDNITVEAVFPIGIEAKNHPTKKAHKKELDNIIYFDRWKNKCMHPRQKVRAEWL